MHRDNHPTAPSIITDHHPPDKPASMMTASEARACVDVIRAGIEDIRKDVLELHERQGWIALGYKSWRECVTAEFGQSQRHLYRALEAGRVERVLSNWSNESERINLPESHARELAPLARKDPEAAREVWREVSEEAERTEQPVTAARVKQFVHSHLRPIPKPEPLRKETTVADIDLSQAAVSLSTEEEFLVRLNSLMYQATRFDPEQFAEAVLADDDATFVALSRAESFKSWLTTFCETVEVRNRPGVRAL